MRKIENKFLNPCPNIEKSGGSSYSKLAPSKNFEYFISI